MIKTRFGSRFLHAGLLQLFLLFSAALAAQVTLKGKVTDLNGNGVPGATVVLRNVAGGTATDPDGNYQFTAAISPGSYTLVFSAIGLKTTEKRITVAGNSVTTDVSLTEDVLALDQVIVTGTSSGTTKKQLGSYIATVKAEDLTKGAPGNVLQALQGKTAGAQITQNSGDPAGGMSVRLRGISSISGSSEPLYIVDGVIVNNATNRVTNTQGNYDGANTVGTVGQNRMVDINPADIERIEVLNGAAAAAIYGSRANSGVVQIFTKRGQSGKPKINFSTSYMNSALRKRLDFSEAPTKFGGPADGPGALTQEHLTFLGNPPALRTDVFNVTRYDYQDDIFRTASGTDNNISISGGNDKTKYFASGSYFLNQGIVRNTDFQRFSFRTNLDQVINSKLSVSVGINYANSVANEKPDGNSFFSPMNSMTILGNFHNIRQRNALGQLQAVGERGRVNPISVIEDFEQRNRTSRIISNLGFKLKPFKGFTLDYTMGIDNYAQFGNTYMPPFAYNVGDGTFGGGATLDATRNGYASAANNLFFGINHDVNATYSFDINKSLNSVTQVGFSQQYERNNYTLVQGRGLAPFVQTATGASTVLPLADDRSELSISGFFLQQNFKYKNHLFVTGAIRRDGSSVFGPDQRNQIYLKASASYVVTSTKYFEKLGWDSWLNLFKLRAAYGESGNLTGIGAYERFNTYSTNSFGGRTSLNSSTARANQEVRPERQQELEVGLDLAFLGSRIGLTANVYNKKVTDLLINRFIAPSQGFTTLRDNLGSMENKGFELVLTGVPFQSKNFSWEITGIFNHNRNRVSNIGQALSQFATNPGAPVALIKGQPVGVFYGTFFATRPGGSFSMNSTGVPNLGGLVLNANGIPVIERGTQNTTTDPLAYTVARDANGNVPNSAGLVRRIIGDPNPDYTTTLINEFRYKKLSFRVQIDALEGAEVWNADFRTRQGVGNGKVAELEHRGQLPRGFISPFNANAPNNSGIYNIEEWRIDDGSFVKLREIALSYSLGRFKGFDNLTLSVSGRNLISWDNYKGYDPETNSAGQSTLLRGIDFGNVPIPRTYSFTVQANF
ncbi:MAG: SusC/RagA family TonB-linked outer membrane protein [Bacteroidetes bacterium]|nr:MAG: SusC/RagA family TonB-linked outer membrane protein [Bacteroidota bacterium]